MAMGWSKEPHTERGCAILPGTEAPEDSETSSGKDGTCLYQGNFAWVDLADTAASPEEGLGRTHGRICIRKGVKF